MLQQRSDRTTSRSHLREKVIFTQRSVSSLGTNHCFHEPGLVMRGTEHG